MHEVGGSDPDGLSGADLRERAGAAVWADRVLPDGQSRQVQMGGDHDVGMVFQDRVHELLWGCYGYGFSSCWLLHACMGGQANNGEAPLVRHLRTPITQLGPQTCA